MATSLLAFCRKKRVVFPLIYQQLCGLFVPSRQRKEEKEKRKKKESRGQKRAGFSRRHAARGRRQHPDGARSARRGLPPRLHASSKLLRQRHRRTRREPKPRCASLCGVPPCDGRQDRVVQAGDELGNARVRAEDQAKQVDQNSESDGRRQE